ncbi:MAG: hypothetical protein WBP21_06105 [Trichococcus flocculiformis]
MLQPDGLLAQLSLVLYHRASTLEFLHQLSDSYRAPWRLLGLDFHQLAIYGLLGTHTQKKRPVTGVFYVIGHSDIQTTMNIYSHFTEKAKKRKLKISRDMSIFRRKKIW